ncbi:unnamed protein product [Ectocarpus sp. 13 AM-2016]
MSQKSKDVLVAALRSLDANMKRPSPYSMTSMLSQPANLDAIASRRRGRRTEPSLRKRC